jgi:hypothetical protein
VFLKKMFLGHILGNLITKSSGHTGPEPAIACAPTLVENWYQPLSRSNYLDRFFVGQSQCDPIGPIFAYWAIVSFQQHA